ncbi:MAG TPA: SDR family oxidoreductase [Rhodothermales bacterium]|nr:SDR family oxidoreductase [Rhodothermales bacterium]
MPLVTITGASQGLGAAIAYAFAQEPNAKLALLARNKLRLDAVAEDCRALGCEAEAIACDVTNEAEVQKAARFVLQRWGATDILVNNAGLFLPGPLLETSSKDFEQQILVNLTSAFYVTQAFLPAMQAQKQGHLFFMASIASLKAYSGGGAYTAAKHGLLGLARAFREEVKPTGIRVTTLMPGATLTPSWDGVDLPEERFMRPEDIAQTIRDIWHLSDRSVVEEVVLRPQLGDI